MFNLLIAFNRTAWESGQRMTMEAERFGEYRGDEGAAISPEKPKSLRALERVDSLLMYEEGVRGQGTDVVRVGQMRDIRVAGGTISFRFTETGRLSRRKILKKQHRLQFGNLESTRTHWAIKDGDIPQDILRSMKLTPKTYDIVLSFAGEDREYVDRVAEFLEHNGVAVFYDKNEEATLWGKDLVEHLDTVFRRLGRFCVVFISGHYAEKMWPVHERRSAFARALKDGPSTSFRFVSTRRRSRGFGHQSVSSTPHRGRQRNLAI